MNWLDFFAEICKIPHPSKREAALAAWLKLQAETAGLTARMDAKGNLAIDREATPGYERRPRVILQAHMDMVPQVRPGFSFDFERDPVPWQIDGDWIHTGGKTTLGADNGIAIALMMELLLDPGTKAGPLRGLFTVEEEIGLNGAAEADPAFLEGDWLVNLDSEDDASFFVGCAGGMRLGAEMRFPLEAVPAGYRGVAIEVSGLPGGHSGVDINKNRGNANAIMLDVLARHPEVRVAELAGGTVDNAIPRECRMTGAAPALPDLAALEAEWRRKLGDNGEQLAIRAGEAPLPAQVWEAGRTKAFVDALRSIPNEVVKMSGNYPGVVETSGNLAAFRTVAPGVLDINTSQRSLIDSEREKLTAAIAAALRSVGAECTSDNFYCAWTPQADSALTRAADAVYLELFGRIPAHEIMHAGLEAATFGSRNSHLQMISVGPLMLDPHSPSERVSISSTERIRQWLYCLLARR